MNILRATTAGEQPDDAQIQQWVDATLSHAKRGGEVSLRIVDEAESAEFNQRYRNMPGPTNVLSFPAGAAPELPAELAAECAAELGDLIVCAPVVLREAIEQGKTPQAHWAHMLVHGVLHLLGHDHAEPAQAQAMEALEIEILQELGYSDPYQN